MPFSQRTAVIAAVALAGLVGRPAAAELIVIDTSERPIRPGLENQGWWPPTLGFSNFEPSDRYVVGRTTPDQADTELRSFFSFYIDPATLRGRVPESVTLRIERYGTVSGDASETLGFFDVSTPPAALADNVLTDVAIWSDLGSGASYGTFDVLAAGAPSDVLSFVLNEAAISAVADSEGGYFSIGAALLSPPGILFATGLPQGVQSLKLRIHQIPEPGALAALAIGACGVALFRRRRFQTDDV